MRILEHVLAAIGALTVLVLVGAFLANHSRYRAMRRREFER